MKYTHVHLDLCISTEITIEKCAEEDEGVLMSSSPTIARHHRDRRHRRRTEDFANYFERMILEWTRIEVACIDRLQRNLPGLARNRAFEECVGDAWLHEGCSTSSSGTPLRCGDVDECRLRDC